MLQKILCKNSPKIIPEICVSKLGPEATRKLVCKIPKLFSKIFPKNNSPKLLLKLLLKIGFSNLFFLYIRKLLNYQNYFPNCSPKRFPKAIAQSCYRKLLWVVCKAAPKSCSPKLFRIIPRAPPQNLFVAISQNYSPKEYRKAVAPKLLCFKPPKPPPLLPLSPNIIF